MNQVNLYCPVLPAPTVKQQVTNVQKGDNSLDFKQILHQELPKAGIIFSSHSLKRLEQNNIQVSSQQIDKLNSAVAKAASKGSRESCIVMDNMAFIVNINNRTVITVVDGPRMKDNVFTNIDSAVII